MSRHGEQGTITASVIVAVTMSLLFVGALIFGVMTYANMQDYKNNSDEKVATAVEVTKKATSTAKDNEFAEASKSPVKNYQGSATYGSVSFDYPKTYSAYVVEQSSDSSPVDGYFHPNIVPSTGDESISFALRYKIVSGSYDTILKSFASNVKSGKTTVSAFRATKVPQTLGARVDGQLTTKKQGTMILLPLRDKTIEIWTESNDYKADFNKYVIPSISFVP